MGGGAHNTHISALYGPRLACNACHGTNTPPTLADGQNLANTAICVNCHSAEAVGTAKFYWNTIGSSAGQAGSWRDLEGDASFCGSCHDATPGNTRIDGAGDAAGNVLGDEASYGFYVTGHGKEAGDYPALSWQDSTATGNPAAGQQCGSCHDLVSQHFDNSARRLAAGFENDAVNTNCQQCHDPGTSATGGVTYYTTHEAYENSAHGALKCTDCHEVHGAAGAHAGMSKAGKEALCYECHTEGMVQNDAIANHRPGGYVSADDIQEAFGKSEKHDLGTVFNLGGKQFSLECVSCHNIHIITGKYWDAEEHMSPVTRFPGNDDTRVTEVWGDEPGEKMDDFAALGTGSGGWYYSIARGGSIVNDQPAVYQPPKAGNGSNFEFGGDVLPDYDTFCLDCHSSRMSDANPPVNWGQGIACTDNSVDPPNQRIECGAQHGLQPAGLPWYVSDSGTAGFWGSSGNPDVLFQMNFVTRGRGAGHFMRWPYDSADRNAGVNFVMACTDCHEAHGSNRGSMIRERFNVNGNGDCGTGGDSSPNGENCSDGGNWNNFCNACHYYYGGQHAGMSCGNASCHEVNSLHRIIHTVDSGSATHLRITSAGYEDDYVAPDFTPEIVAVEGNIGSDELAVTFRKGVYTNDDLTGAINPGDFWFFDVGGDNPKSIDSIDHTAGAATATFTLSAPLIEADLTQDILAATGQSIWCWYEGGYNNYATGIIQAQTVSAGPWPARIAPAIYLTMAEGAVDYDGLLVTFAAGVYANADATGALEPADFVLVDTDDARYIESVDHVPGEATARLTLSADLDDVDDIDVDTIAAASISSIYGAEGDPIGTSAVTIAGTDCPVAGTRFDFDEPAGSALASDESGLLAATVGNPAVALQGDGFFHGDGITDSTYLYHENDLACLDEGNTLTYEMRFKPAVVDLDSEELNPGNTLDRTVQTLFERKFSYNVKISRADFWRDGNPPPGNAFIYTWYHPNNQPEGGRAWHQAFADGAGRYYIQANHWYKMRLVHNANRVGGIPVDFFLDDEGTDGLGAGEAWAGYINCTRPPGEIDTYRSTEGNEIEPVSGKISYPFSIGALSKNKNNALNGLVDWIEYKPAADYSGLDSPAPTQAVASDGQVRIEWGAVDGATSYNIYWDISSGVAVSTGTPITGVTSPYTHGGLANGTTYYYIVTAMKDVDGVPGDEELASSEVKAMPVNAAPASPPSNVVAEGFKKIVQLTWTGAPLATSYNIYWSASPGVTTATGSKITGATSPYVHVWRANATAYYYIITSVNALGEHPAASGEVSATANPHPTATVVAGDQQVELSWGDVNGATSYNIYWKTDPEVTRATANQLVGVTSPYVHSGLTNGTTYYYMMSAVHPTGDTFGPYTVSATPTN
ncbi:MAG: hypothetical protein GWP08_18060 [Nitrospiraceae bacterium]|nr:hypothetical protein [Nitrospiraceae bacterium]